MAKKPFKTYSTADANKLKSLVRAFNKKVTQVSKTPTLKDAQPNKIKYSEITKDIHSRAEYNRVYNVYSRYLNRGAERIYTNEQGVRLTRWLRNESQYLVRRINAMREKKRIQFENLPGGIRKDSRDELDLDPRRNHIKTTPRKQYAEKLFRGMMNQANTDYYNVGAERYKQNYLSALSSQFSGVQGFDVLYRKIKSLSPQFLIEAVAQDPTFAVNFLYDFGESEVRTEYLINAWDDYINDREYFDE